MEIPNESGNPITKISDEQKPEDSSKSTENFSFGMMKLAIGDRLQVQFSKNLRSERSFVKLIGFLEPETLLITTPITENGTYLQLLEHDLLVIRTFSKKAAFAFSTTVERVCKLPYQYLHIAFPSRIEGALIRKSVRIATKTTTTVIAGSMRQVGIISNMSYSGAQLDIRSNVVDVGDLVILQFKLIVHDVLNQINVNGIIRTKANAISTGNSSISNCGIEFNEPDPSTKMLIKSFVCQRIFENPECIV